MNILDLNFFFFFFFDKKEKEKRTTLIKFSFFNKMNFMQEEIKQNDFLYVTFLMSNFYFYGNDREN